MNANTYFVLCKEQDTFEAYVKAQNLGQVAYYCVTNLDYLRLKQVDMALERILRTFPRVIMPDFKENVQAPFILRHLFLKMKEFDIDTTKLEQYSQKNLESTVHNYITGEENAP